MKIRKLIERLQILTLLALCTVHSCSSTGSSGEIDENFLIVDHLSDNERETRIRWRDLMGKETTLDLEGDERYANSSFAQLALWQISDGHKFAQLVFNNRELVECEFLRDGREFADEFIDKFIEDFNFIRRRQRQGNRRDTHRYSESSNLQHSEELTNMKPNITFTQLRRLQDIPDHFLSRMHLHMLEFKCTQLHERQQRMRTLATTNDHDDDDFDQAIAPVDSQNARTKRQTESWFIAPNSKWCGKGRSAESYAELGPRKGDACCRKHDHCRMSIPSFTSKYGLFNQSPFAMSHCRCDRRFRTCLKMADAADANIVGKLFFNFMQIKCFVLKPEKTCILHSYWGKCLKFKTKKKAYLRDNQKY